MRRGLTLSKSLLTTIRGLMLAGFAVGTVSLVLAVMPSIQAQGATCALGLQQAEDGVLTGFEVGTDPAADNGAFIHMPDGAGSRWSPSTAFRAQYCFTVEADGTYRLESGVWADATTNDSFFVAIDGTMHGDGRWDVRLNTGYEMDEANSYQVADPIEVQLAKGDHTVDIYLREDGTRLDHLELVPVTPDDLPRCRTGWAQAEAGTLIGFTAARHRGASGRASIHVPEGSGSSWQPSNSARAIYCFEVSEPGIYRVQGRTYAPDYASDSFFVQVNDGDIWEWYVATSTRYRNDLVNDWGREDPAEVWLDPGTHTVTVYAREDGARLDRIRLRQEQASSCQAGRIEAEDANDSGFTAVSDRSASGGEYLHVPNGEGSSWSPSESHEIEFCFNVANPGTYELVAGVWADATTNDSFWVKVDGAVQGRWDTLLNTSYSEDVVGIRGGADPLLLNLGAGDHVVEIMLREDGTRLDWLELRASG